MDRRITTSLPSMPQLPSEQPSERFARIAREEVSLELEQSTGAERREELALEQASESLAESHELNDRFIRLVEEDFAAIFDEERERSERASTRLKKPRERSLTHSQARPTLNDMLRALPENNTPYDAQRGFRALKFKQFAFDRQRKARDAAPDATPRAAPATQAKSAQSAASSAPGAEPTRRKQ